MQLGKYRHYKGSICDVIGIAKHTETLEDMVVYKHYDDAKGHEEINLRVRPKAIFEEIIVREGKEIKRFEYIGE